MHLLQKRLDATQIRKLFVDAGRGHSFEIGTQLFNLRLKHLELVDRPFRGR